LLGPMDGANLRHWTLALSNGPSRVGVSFPSPEDGSRSSFRNVVFSSYLEFRTMDKVQKPSDSERIMFLDETPLRNARDKNSTPEYTYTVRSDV
jgi:hypothetical protein